MAQGRDVTVRSAAILLDIKADPTGTGDWFLPARDMLLSAAWQPETPVFRTGEAALRKVQILVLGASDVQLPDPDAGTAEGLRLYLDGSETRTVDVPGAKGAVREFRYCVVPTRGGKITLPEIRLNWFNTTTETAQTAILPAETITVIGAPPAMSDDNATPVSAPAPSPAPVATTTYWPWLLAALAKFGAALSIWRLAMRQNRHGAAGMTPAAPDRRSCGNALRACCRERRPRGA